MSSEVEHTDSIDDAGQDAAQQTEGTPAVEQASSESAPVDELNDKYVRLYAEFDNYKKRVNRDKEELVRYGNESLLYELLPAIDNLELALKHASSENPTGLIQGVEMTFKELQRTLEKFGLTRIEASGRPFDPAVHHAMSQVERSDMEDKMVVEEFRTGYRYREKVLRPSLVSVSTRPRQSDEKKNDTEETGATSQETAESDITA